MCVIQNNYKCQYQDFLYVTILFCLDIETSVPQEGTHNKEFSRWCNDALVSFNGFWSPFAQIRVGRNQMQKPHTEQCCGSLKICSVHNDSFKVDIEPRFSWPTNKTRIHGHCCLLQLNQNLLKIGCSLYLKIITNTQKFRFDLPSAPRALDSETLWKWANQFHLSWQL